MPIGFSFPKYETFFRILYRTSVEHNADIRIYILYPIKTNILHILVEQDMPYILVTVMDYIQNADVSILDLLLLHQDHKGKIPLEIAAREKHVKCVMILLRYEQVKDITTRSYRIDNTPYLFYSSMTIQHIDQYHECK